MTLIEKARIAARYAKEGGNPLTSELLNDLATALEMASRGEDKIARLLHYPEHWDVMAYPALYDAVNEIHNGCGVCKEPEVYPGYRIEGQTP